MTRPGIEPTTFRTRGEHANHHTTKAVNRVIPKIKLLAGIFYGFYNIYYISLYFQDQVPFNKGAFKVEINFPAEYPFKPPKVTFKTKIYHPNIDEKGQVCLPIISPEHWKPATKTDQGMEYLIILCYHNTAVFEYDCLIKRNSKILKGQTEIFKSGDRQDHGQQNETKDKHRTLH